MCLLPQLSLQLQVKPLALPPPGCLLVLWCLPRSTLLGRFLLLRSLAVFFFSEERNPLLISLDQKPGCDKYISDFCDDDGGDDRYFDDDENSDGVNDNAGADDSIDDRVFNVK